MTKINLAKHVKICQHCYKRIVEDGKNRCSFCNQKNREQYYKRKAGLVKPIIKITCDKCGSTDIQKNYKNCDRCHELKKQYERDWYHKNPTKKLISAYIYAENNKETISKKNRLKYAKVNPNAKRMRKEELIEKGICTRCRTRQATTNKKLCSYCSEIGRKHAEKQRAKQKLQPVPEGMCSNCRKRPIEIGKKRCAICNAKNRENLKIGREKNPEKFKMWDKNRHNRDKTKRNAASSKYRAEHRDAINKQQRKWYYDNRYDILFNRQLTILQDEKSRAIYKIKLAGCSKCGNKDIRVIQFHHRNPKEKIFNINAYEVPKHSWEEIIEEIKKCDLLCANCHIIEHNTD